MLLDATQLTVLQNGVTKILNTDYTVYGVGLAGGGSITFTVAPLTGDAIAILHNQPTQQLSVYTPNEAFPAKRIETDLDKQTLIQQQQDEILRRSLRAPQRDNLDMTLPSVANRASQFLGFDANGLPVAMTTPAGVQLLPIPLPTAQGGTGTTGSYTVAGLPSAGAAGRIARITTGKCAGATVVDDGSQWRTIAQKESGIINPVCPPYNAAGDGSTDDSGELRVLVENGAGRSAMVRRYIHNLRYRGDAWAGNEFRQLHD